MKKLCIVLLVGLIAGPPMAYGQSTYRWVDEKGGVHFTDDPTGIPEKYQVQERKGSPASEPLPATPKGQSPVSGPVPKPAAPGKGDEPVTGKKDALGRGEDWWRSQVALWQEKLAGAQRNYQSANAAVKEKEQELEQAKFKPDSLKRKLRGELKGLQDKASEYAKQVDEARNMLDRGLAKQAEEYLADPNWVKSR
jgi:hypothetical protein